MATKCLHCGNDNPSGFRFCGHCGKPMQATVQTGNTPVAIGTGSATSFAERRPLTVLFCDLKDSVALSERFDPEDYSILLTAYRNACDRVIARFGGEKVRYIGDGIRVYFGYQHAREDSAERAVHTGHNIVQAVAALNATGPFAGVVELAVRVGIATGLVVAGGEDGQSSEAVGITPNLAARIQSMAAPNTVVLGERTKYMLGDLFDYEDLGNYELKGFSEPVSLWQVLAVQEGRSRFEATRSTATQLIGREQEILRLQQRWQAARAGEGGVVLISGEAGVGKSRLARVLLEQLPTCAPYRFIHYQCSPHYQNSALYPVVSQLERDAGFTYHDSDDEKVQKLADLLLTTQRSKLSSIAILANLLSLTRNDNYPLVNSSSQQLKDETLAVLVEQMCGLAELKPVLILFEDIHWLDPTSKELIDKAIAAAFNNRVFIVITYRPEFIPDWLGQSHVEVMIIKRLNQPQSAQLVRQILGQRSLPEAIVERIVSKTDGVPLFIEEFIKALLDLGILAAQGGQLTITAPELVTAIPATLHDSLMARLDQSKSLKAMAQLCAVIGREFPTQLLVKATQLPLEQVHDLVQQLVKAEVIVRVPARVQEYYSFKHALLQDAAYDSLVRSRRQALHARIATVMETEFKNLWELHPERLARHFSESGLTEKAVQYWHQAATQARDKYAHVEATAHYSKAITMVHKLSDSDTRALAEMTLQMNLGAQLIPTKGGSAAEVEQSFHRAHELSQSVGQTPSSFRALSGLQSYYVMRGKLQTAFTIGERLIDLAAKAEQPVWRFQAFQLQGLCQLFLGELQTGRQYLLQALKLYDPNHITYHHQSYSADPQVLCYCNLAWAEWVLGNPQTAVQHSEYSLRLARELDYPHTLAFALGLAASFNQSRGETKRVLHYSKALIKLAQQHQFAYWMPWGQALKSWAMLSIDKHDQQALADLQQSLEAFQTAGAELMRPYFLGLYAESLAHLQHYEQGFDVVDDALAIVEQLHIHCFAPDLLRLKARLSWLLNSSAIDTADDYFAQAITAAQQQNAKLLQLRTLLAWLQITQQPSKQQALIVKLNELYKDFNEFDSCSDLHQAKTVLTAGLTTF